LHHRIGQPYTRNVEHRHRRRCASSGRSGTLIPSRAHSPSEYAPPSRPRGCAIPSRASPAVVPRAQRSINTSDESTIAETPAPSFRSAKASYCSASRSDMAASRRIAALPLCGDVARSVEVVPLTGRKRDCRLACREDSAVIPARTLQSNQPSPPLLRRRQGADRRRPILLRDYRPRPRQARDISRSSWGRTRRQTASRRHGRRRLAPTTPTDAFHCYLRSGEDRGDADRSGRPVEQRRAIRGDHHAQTRPAVRITGCYLGVNEGLGLKSHPPRRNREIYVDPSPWHPNGRRGKRSG
jgi:hypothetical protein